MIEPLEMKRAREVALLQRRVLPQSPLSQLGQRFLEEFYYPTLIQDPSVVALVCLHEGRLEGFLIGTSRRQGFLQRLAFSNPLLLTKVLLISACRSLSIALTCLKVTFHLLGVFLHRREPHIENACGEFITIAISPPMRHKYQKGEKRPKPANDLMDEGLQQMKLRRCESIVALIEPGNFLSEVFFKHYGFKPGRELKFFGVASRSFLKQDV